MALEDNSRRVLLTYSWKIAGILLVIALLSKIRKKKLEDIILRAPLEINLMKQRIDLHLNTYKPVSVILSMICKEGTSDL